MAGCFRRSAHQQLARHLAPHDLDLLLRDALGDEAADEHRVAVGLRRVARLAKVGAEDEVLGSDLLDVCGRLFVGDLAPVAHPREVGLRPHEGPHRVDLQLRAHRRGLPHLLGRHVDNLELGMGHHDPVAAGVTRRLDDREHLGGRRVARAEDELLLGADLPDLAQGWQRLAVGADDLDSFRRVLEVLHVVVGVEGRQPHDATVATLHPPHPLDGLGIETTRGAVQRDSAEGLDAGVVLADEPRAIGGERHVVLEDDGLHLAGQVELGHLVVVDRAAEDVGGAVVVEVDQTLDRTDRRRRGREDAHLRGRLRRQVTERCQAGDARGRALEEVSTAPAVRRHVERVRLRRVSPGVAATVGEPPSGERERFHGNPSSSPHVNDGSMRTSIRYGPPPANPRSTAGAISGAFSTRSAGTPRARAMPTKSMSGSRSIPTYRSSSAEKPLSARVRCLRIRYDALLKITYTTASDSRGAVQSAWFVYMALPSPTSASTGRTRSASFTPSAAGSPQPMPPPRRPKKLFRSAQRKKWRTPWKEEMDSSTIAAFAGAHRASSWTSVSGASGTRAASASARCTSAARSRSQAARTAAVRWTASGWPCLPVIRRTASLSP